MSSFIRPEASVYRMIECLGEGLSSRVFAAIREDSRGFSKQQVVLKILKTETDVRWLKQEFEALSKIRSPNCVSILGWENLPEGPALVLEHIEGLDLREIAVHHSFTAEEVDELIFQIQQALCAVHIKNLCHGDLSLSNIMIDRTGTVRLIDFALSASAQKASVGTPAYMAPEVWDGKHPTGKSDLFSLGLIAEDLRNGIRAIPKGNVECRARALGCTNKNSLLLENVSERTALAVAGNEGAKEKLGKLIDELIDLKRETKVQTVVLDDYRTQAISQQNQFSFSLRIASMLIGLILILPAFAKQSILGPQLIEASCLEFRSEKWLEISIDGVSKGYAPLKVCNLSTGSHLIRWRSSLGSGQLDIKLKAGENRLLSASQLKPVH